MCRSEWMNLKNIMWRKRARHKNTYLRFPSHNIQKQAILMDGDRGQTSSFP